MSTRHDYKDLPTFAPQLPRAEWDAGMLTGFSLALLVIACLCAVLPMRWATVCICLLAVALFARFAGKFIASQELP